jgi:hypothetical protein
MSLILSVLLVLTMMPAAFAGSDGKVSVMSLLPLDEYEYNVDIGSYFPVELKKIPLSTILNNDVIKNDLGTDPFNGKNIVYAIGEDSDDFSEITKDGTIDLSEYEDSETTLTLIVGSAKQLDPDNKKYIIKIKYNILSYDDLFDFSIYKDADGERSEIKIWDQSCYMYNDDDYEYFDEMSYGVNNDGYYYIRADGKNLKTTDDFWLGMSLKDNLSQEYSVKIYSGETDITDKILNQSMSEIDKGYKCDKDSWETSSFDEYHDYLLSDISIELYKNNNLLETKSFDISIVDEVADISMGLFSDHDGHEYVNNTISDWFIDDNNVETVTLSLYKGYKADEQYYLRMYYQNPDSEKEDDRAGIKYAVLGHYDTVEAVSSAIENNTVKDIKKPLICEYSQVDNGYLDDYSGDGVDFTVVDQDNEIYKLTVKAVEGNVSKPEKNIVDGSDSSSEIYFGPYGFNFPVSSLNDDSYYNNGIRTLMVWPTSDVDLADVSLGFHVSGVSSIYASGQKITGDDGIWKMSKLDFTKGPIEFTVTGSDEKTVKNYWVTLVDKCTSGAKLLLNGINESNTVREIYMSPFNQKHDICIANIGKEALTNLNVKLENPSHIKLDKYWTVGGTNNNTLAAYDSDSAYSGGNAYSKAMIRLLPDGEGDISGTLTITADNQDPVVITLTGKSGDVDITTSDLNTGVKYVPYSAMFQTSDMYGNITTSFSIQGKLPQGMSLDSKTGQLEGIPTESGTFPIAVSMKYALTSAPTDTRTATKQFTLEIKDNTDENVSASTDTGYEITTPVTKVMSEYKDAVMEISGDGIPDDTYYEFKDLYIDGEKLTKDVDYTVESGSTKITIKAQTFAKAGAGKHTITAEFRKSGTNELKKSVQNYTSTVSAGNSGNSGGSGHSGGSGSSGSSASKPTTTQQPQTDVQTPVQTPVADEQTGFTDVSKTAWYYEDLTWASTNKLMLGVGNNKFNPSGKISDSMVVTVLARMAKIDTDTYTDTGNTGIAAGQWYTAAALWAKDMGIISNDFSPVPPCRRGDLAVMLTRYLDSQNITYSASDTASAFADESQMSASEKYAFSKLVQLGIFKGKGDNRMDPNGETTRAELAALLHRISDVVVNDSTESESVDEQF